MKAVGYIRVSTTEQATEGHSLDAQREIITRFVRQRGWELVEVYVDTGISGTRSDRPALQRLLRDAEQGAFEVVIVHAIDRFYRNLQGLLKALNHLYQHDVAFISIGENMDFTTPWGKLTLAVLGTLAEIYIDKLSAETKKGKRARAMKGLYNGSVPLGYCRGNCSTCTDPNGKGYCPRFGGPDLKDERPSLPLFVHPIEGEAVKLAFEWYATGRFSDGQIAEKLNAQVHVLPDGTTVPLRSKGRPGRSEPGHFSKDSLREVLQNYFYTGVVPYYGDRKKKRSPVALYPGKHPPLISQELFDRCLELRRLHGSRPRRRGDTVTRVYPLSGLLRCGQCGSKMRAQGGSSGNGRYYVCSARLQHTLPCDEPAVQALEIEEQVANYLGNLPFPEDWEAWVYEQLKPKWDVEEARRQEQALHRRLERAVELYLANDISKARYEEEKRYCERQLANLRPGEIYVTISLVKTLVEFKARWAGSSNLEKKKLLRLALAAAYVRGQCLTAVQPKALLYPLLQNLTLGGDGFYSGSDGNSPTFQ